MCVAKRGGKLRVGHRSCLTRGGIYNEPSRAQKTLSWRMDGLPVSVHFQGHSAKAEERIFVFSHEALQDDSRRGLVVVSTTHIHTKRILQNHVFDRCISSPCSSTLQYPLQYPVSARASSPDKGTRAPRSTLYKFLGQSDNHSLFDG